MTSFLPTINFGGLASGLDTNSLIDQLMAIERRPQVRINQKKLVEDARLAALRDVETRLSNLSLKVASLRDAATWADVQTVESSATSVLTATRTAGAAPGAYTVSVTQLARAHQISQGALGASSAPTAGTLDIKVGTGSTVSVSIAAGDNIDAIVSKINGTSNIPVYASNVNGKLYLSGKTTGASQTIDVTGSLAASLGVNSLQAVTTISAQSASLTVNGGAPVVSESNTVTTAISGISMTLKASGTSTVTVGAPGPDTAAITTKIQEFVDQYNSTVDFIQSKLNEKKVAQPKTDADRQKGVLFGDSGLTSLLSSLRQSVGSVVQGRPADLSMLSQVGLSTGATTGSSSYSEDSVAGKLTLDSGKLSEKLTGWLNDVKALFTNATGSFNTEGLSQRLDRYLDPYLTTGGIMDSRIAAEEDLIESLTDRSAEFDQRLALREANLRKQFTALETALSSAQQQGAWLSSQLAGLSRK